MFKFNRKRVIINFDRYYLGNLFINKIYTSATSSASSSFCFVFYDPFKTLETSLCKNFSLQKPNHTYIIYPLYITLEEEEKQIKMGLISKEEISKSRRHTSSLWRGIKTIFVLFTMFLSFIIFSAPIFLAVADAVLPSAILSSSSLNRLSPSSFPATIYSYLSNYDLRYSLIDIPLISIIRSAIILCK